MRPAILRKIAKMAISAGGRLLFQNRKLLTLIEQVFSRKTCFTSKNYVFKRLDIVFWIKYWRIQNKCLKKIKIVLSVWKPHPSSNIFPRNYAPKTPFSNITTAPTDDDAGLRINLGENPATSAVWRTECKLSWWQQPKKPNDPYHPRFPTPKWYWKDGRFHDGFYPFTGTSKLEGWRYRNSTDSVQDKGVGVEC